MATDDKSSPPSTPSIEEILKDARAELASIKICAETSKAIAAEATESQKVAVAALADAKTKLDEIITAATQAVAAKAKITDDQAVIATKSDHIDAAQKHAATVRADLDRQLTAATQQATTAEAQQSKAQSAADNAAKLLASIQTTKGSVESEVTTITTAKKTAVESANLTKSLADKSVEVETRIAAYEKRLAELDALCATQLKTIEDLLPGATAAGLASSWDERRKTFLKPHNRWQFLFVLSVLAIVGLAATGLWHVLNAATPPTYDELLRLWLARLPIAGALIWLALHASHESALAKRLEEEYGYKATVASCLMGFQKQISEVGKDAVSNPSLSKLLDNTLTTIAAPPGRIYDKHKLTASPSGELAEAAKIAARGAGK